MLPSNLTQRPLLSRGVKRFALVIAALVLAALVLAAWLYTSGWIDPFTVFTAEGWSWELENKTNKTVSVSASYHNWYRNDIPPGEIGSFQGGGPQPNPNESIVFLGFVAFPGGREDFRGDPQGPILGTDTLLFCAHYSVRQLYWPRNKISIVEGHDDSPHCRRIWTEEQQRLAAQEIQTP
jgi:hypothetical protein